MAAIAGGYTTLAFCDRRWLVLVADVLARVVLVRGCVRVPVLVLRSFCEVKKEGLLSPSFSLRLMTSLVH